MNDLIPFQYEEKPVRVVLVAGDPWFVANDIARVLGYKRAHEMVRNLDEDEKGSHIVRTLGGMQEHSVISESGMYAAIFKSRRPEAQTFRRWVTGEVLPTVRRTGQFVLHENVPPPEVPSDFDPTRLTACVTVVREARRLFGPRSARSVWMQLGLPHCIADAEPTHDGDPLTDPLSDWIVGKTECTIEEAAKGIGIIDPERSVRFRIGAALRLLGWHPTKARRGVTTVNLFRPVLSVGA